MRHVSIIVPTVAFSVLSLVLGSLNRMEIHRTEVRTTFNLSMIWKPISVTKEPFVSCSSVQISWYLQISLWFLTFKLSTWPKIHLPLQHPMINPGPLISISAKEHVYMGIFFSLIIIFMQSKKIWNTYRRCPNTTRACKTYFW